VETERAVDGDAMLASDVTVVVDEGGEKAVAETDGSRDDVERMEPGQEVVDDEQQLNADDDVIPAGDVDDSAGTECTRRGLLPNAVSCSVCELPSSL